MKSQGFRLKEDAIETINRRADITGKSRSELVAELIEKATFVPSVAKKTAVSYGMPERTLSHLQGLALRSGRSQAEVIEYLVSQS